LEPTIQDTARFARARKAFHHCHQCFILIRQRTGLPGLAPAATCALAGRRRWRWRCLRGSSCTALEAVEALLHLLEALGQHLDALDRQLQEVHRSSCSFVSQTASCLQLPRCTVHAQQCVVELGPWQALTAACEDSCSSPPLCSPQQCPQQRSCRQQRQIISKKQR